MSNGELNSIEYWEENITLGKISHKAKANGDGRQRGSILNRQVSIQGLSKMLTFELMLKSHTINYYSESII